jgi:hypothetical protein
MASHELGRLITTKTNREETIPDDPRHPTHVTAAVRTEIPVDRRLGGSLPRDVQDDPRLDRGELFQPSDADAQRLGDRLGAMGRERWRVDEQDLVSTDGDEVPHRCELDRGRRATNAASSRSGITSARAASSSAEEAAAASEDSAWRCRCEPPGCGCGGGRPCGGGRSGGGRCGASARLVSRGAPRPSRRACDPMRIGHGAAAQARAVAAANVVFPRRPPDRADGGGDPGSLRSHGGVLRARQTRARAYCMRSHIYVALSRGRGGGRRACNT